MLKYSLPTRIRLELFRRAKYGLFMASGRSRARALVSKIANKRTPLVITIAFNDPSLIRLQIENFQRFCREDHEFVVADNSPDRRSSQKLLDTLEGLDFHYVRLPYNLYTNSRGAAKPGRGSLSHSVALNWVWRYIVERIAPDIVVVLDHDVFPIKSVSLREMVSPHLTAGPKREGATRWTTWPGLTVFRFDDLPNTRLSFTPSGDLDSGAGLWDSLYHELTPEDVNFLKREFVQVLDGVPEVKGQIEVIDSSWLHLMDGSGWFDGTGKAEEILSSPALEERLSPEVLAAFRRIAEISAR